MFRSYKDVEIVSPEVSNKRKLQPEEEEIFNCDYCGEGSWTNEIEFDIHRRTEHKWELMRALKDKSCNMCSICLREQETKKQLVDHILVNHLYCPPNATRITRQIYICDHCNRLFFNKQLLICHIYHWHSPNTKHKPLLRTECPKCMKTINCKSIWFHLLYHGAFLVGTCPVCLKTCEGHADLLEHIKTHTGYFVCNICDFATTKESFFNSHIVTHNKKYVCDGEDFERFFLPRKVLPSMNNRMTNLYKGIPLAKQVRICVLCRAICLSTQEMKQHIFGDHVPEVKDEVRVHRCACGEEFTHSVLLRHHIFKLKGGHKVCEASSAPAPESPQMFVDYEIVSDTINIGVNEIVIPAIIEETHQNSVDQIIIQDFKEIES